MNCTRVEVRKNPRSTTWYNATIQDMKNDSVSVAFEDAIWPSREVPAISVRRCPQENSNDGFDPKVDEVVEVSVSASESNPSGWSLGKVKTIKNSFYFIGFEGVARGAQELIVERSALRRVSNEAALDSSNLERLLIDVPDDLYSWIRSQDSLGCLSHLQAKGRLLVASSINLNGDSKHPPQVLVIGDKRSVDLSEKLLVQIHFRNQLEIQRFHELHERLKQRLGEYGTKFKEVFTIDQVVVGRVIGSKGANIKLLREKYDVDIRVDNDEYDRHSGRETATVTVTGTTEESVKRAREQMEYITVKLPVDPSQVGWILGKGYQNIQDIKVKTELFSARFDDKSSSLELCGLRSQVEDAKLLISVHSEYLPVYKEMDEEQHTIQQSFDQLDNTGVGKRGRKGGGGKGDKAWKGSEDTGAKGGKGKESKGGKDNWNDSGGGKHGGGYDRSDDQDSYPALSKSGGKSGDSKGEGKGRGAKGRKS